MSDVILELKGVTKSFNGHTILNNIDYKLKRGEIHAIIGENGAGKSTLVKILSGLYPIDSGCILFEDERVNVNKPVDSIILGISIVQQDPYLFDHLTVAENIFANAPPIKNNLFRTINKNHMYSQAQELLDSLEFSLRADTFVGLLNLGQKRMVELAKAFCHRAKVIILDEPTASLSAVESDALFKKIKSLKAQGISVIYISQRYEEIIKLADRITVLRDGAITGCMAADAVDFQSLVSMIWGRCLHDRYPKLAVKQGHEIFAVEALNSGGYLNNISFSVAKGEIVGITGLIGSGRTKLARLVFGLEQKSSGEIYIDRLKAFIKSPRDAIDLGLAYVTENRFNDGLFGNLSALDNAFSVINSEDEKLIYNKNIKNGLFKRYIKKANIDIRPSDRIMELSGGDQQKIMLIRWFLTVARVVIFDEPTRGVDIASKVDIYNLINDLARKEAGIIMISSDIEELVGMCDRIIIMRNGGIAADLCRNEFSYEKIYYYAARS
jgi:ABC-type sugar transport system ATPase subunit